MFSRRREPDGTPLQGTEEAENIFEAQRGSRPLVRDQTAVSGPTALMDQKGRDDAALATPRPATHDGPLLAPATHDGPLLFRIVHNSFPLNFVHGSLFQ